MADLALDLDDLLLFELRALGSDDESGVGATVVGAAVVVSSCVVGSAPSALFISWSLCVSSPLERRRPANGNDMRLALHLVDEEEEVDIEGGVCTGANSSAANSRDLESADCNCAVENETLCGLGREREEDAAAAEREEEGELGLVEDLREAWEEEEEDGLVSVDSSNERRRRSRR